MASSLSFQSITTVTHPYSGDGGRGRGRDGLLLRRKQATVVSCRGQNPQTSKGPEPENVFLKIAWYGSELLGIAASVFRSPESSSPSSPIVPVFEVPVDCSGRAVRVAVVDSIKQDFKRSYFVTGNLTPEVYEEKCEFADPAGSFKGLARFKRNCTNFGSLIEKSNMKLMKWENFEDKGVGHWKFSCVMSFPWKPILSATGYTEYYFDSESGKICRHVEHWNVPKIALFKQLLRPSRGLPGTQN
ncbi:hypothetical protein AALP_AA4G251000 [Arabis alpina]|uniref:Uncharacterized protein n=1 Tax=Arabis alpina TaxID=50452 RepID=A0A087H5I6_ARAAL|nr:hypothetical protein AALP_AA4G251000 [Arabis alpina]